MLLPDHEFIKPQSVAELVDLLARETRELKLIAGGTDVTFNMRGRLFQPELLVSIKDIAELKTLALDADGTLRIGASCRLSDLERDPRVMARPGLIDGIKAVASRHVRNMATLGGNLNLDTRCWYTNQTDDWRKAKGPCLKANVDACHAIKSSPICVALNASDTAPGLIALDASVELVSSRGTRTVKLADYYTEDGVVHTVRAADEFVASILVPANTDRVVYIKETARKGNDFAYATIAARADGTGEQCTSARLVMGSLTTRPTVLERTAAILVQEGLGDAAIDKAATEVRTELGALTNLYTPAAYKSRIARSLVRDALRQLRAL